VPNRQRSQLDLERVVDVGVGKDQQPVVVEQPAQGVRGLPFRERYVVQPRTVAPNGALGDTSKSCVTNEHN
jgi:hypothetical protein